MPNWKPIPNVTRRTTTTSESPLISVQRAGALVLNAATLSLLDHPKQLELLYDEEAKVIGLRPVPEDTAGAYTLYNTRSANEADASKISPKKINVKSFLEQYDLLPEAAIRYAATLEDGVLCVDLNREGSSWGSAGPRGHAEEEEPAEAPAAPPAE